MIKGAIKLELTAFGKISKDSSALKLPQKLCMLYLLYIAHNVSFLSGFRLTISLPLLVGYQVTQTFTCYHNVGPLARAPLVFGPSLLGKDQKRLLFPGHNFKNWRILVGIFDLQDCLDTMEATQKYRLDFHLKAIL